MCSQLQKASFVVQTALWRLNHFKKSWGKYKNIHHPEFRRAWLKAKTIALINHDRILNDEVVSRNKKKGA